MFAKFHFNLEITLSTFQRTSADCCCYGNRDKPFRKKYGKSRVPPAEKAIILKFVPRGTTTKKVRKDLDTYKEFRARGHLRVVTFLKIWELA